MTAECKLRLSVNICIFLCIYVSFVNYKSFYLQKSTSLNVSDMYFVSKVSCRTEIAGNLRQQRNPPGDKELSNSLKAVMLCNLFHGTCFALALIVLAGDIESNPDYQTLDDIRNTRGLKIAHLNIHKTDSLRLQGVDSKTVDILTLSEAWLDGNICDTEINLPGFVCVRQGRTGIKERYSGVAVYVREGLAFRLRIDINTGGQECPWIELIRDKCKLTLVCCAYRAPDSDFQTFISSLHESISSVDLEKSDVVILGDLNAEMMASFKLPKRDKQELLNFSRAYNFTEPTRMTDTSRTMIDLVFANIEHHIVKSGVVPVTRSDHFLVFCIIKAGNTTKAKPRILEYRSYKNFNSTLFNDDLRNIPWHIVENEDNVDDALFTWNKMFLEVADQHAPVKRRRVKGTPLSWMNCQISDTMKERDWAHRKAPKSNSALHWYVKLRNKVNGLVRTVKSKYYCDMKPRVTQKRCGKRWTKHAIETHLQREFSVLFLMVFSI